MLFIRVLGAIMMTFVLCIVGTALGLWMWLNLSGLLAETMFGGTVFLYGSVILVFGVGILAGAAAYRVCLYENTLSEGLRVWAVICGVVWLGVVWYVSTQTPPLKITLP